MRSGYADRIISSQINLVQYLNRNPVSYILLGIVLTGSISYLGVNEVGHLISYVGTIPADDPTLWISIISTLPMLGMTMQTGFDAFDDDDDDEGDDDDPEKEGIIFAHSGGPDDKDGEDSEDDGIIYARVSSDSQKEHSIETQIDTLRKRAQKEGINLPYEPERDEGKTGGNFQRDGIKRIFELAKKKKITHLLVDDVSRIGRNAPQTLYFIYVLKKKFGVTIITAKGDLDINEIDDLLDATLTSLVSHISAKNRGRKALDTRIRRFKEERSWFSWFRNVPLGYQKTDDGWIEPDPDEIELVEKMFEKFLDGNSYGKIQDDVNGLAKNRDLDPDLSPSQVKRSLRNPVYIGAPSMSSDTRDLDGKDAVVEDDDLQIIDDETFQRAQDEIEQRRRKSSSGDDAMDVDDFIETFGLLAVLDSSPIVRLACPVCDSDMVQNGERDLITGLVYNYICTDCGKQRKFPKKGELESMVETIRAILDEFDVSLDDD